MFDVEVTWNRDQVQRLLNATSAKQWTFATTRGLTGTAFAIKDAERAEMGRVFDRPVAFTLNSLRVDKATKTKLVATVRFAEPTSGGRSAARYLQPQVFGGGRRHVAFEGAMRRRGLLGSGRFIVPASGAPLDRAGNVARRFYGQVLRGLDARGGSSRTRFFFGEVRGHRGIWMARGRHVQAVFLEVGAPSYEPRFDFFGVAERIARERFGTIFEQSLAEAMRTAR